MNNECLMQWNCLKKEAAEDFPLEKLESGLRAYLDESRENGDQTARAALRSIREALKCVEHEDQCVKHKARKLLKSCHHSFESACENVGQFTKALTVARERRFESQATPKVIPLGGEFRLEEVVSINRLMVIGKTLEICVSKRDTARRFLQEVETGAYRLWLLLKREEPYALLQIGLQENEVVKFSAHDNDDPEISYELAMELLHKLGVTADYDTSFTRVGAFGRFKGGRPEVEPVRVGDKEMWIWLYQDELIVAMEEHADGKLFWSRYELTRAGEQPWHDESRNLMEWDDHCSNHLSLGMLFEIVRRNPQVFEKFRSPIIAEPTHVKLAA